MLHAAMDLAKPGDVIVIDAGGFEDRAIFGELMATYMKVRGIRGVICDGAIRDYGGLAALEGFQVYARSASPNGPYKNGPGEINAPWSAAENWFIQAISLLPTTTACYSSVPRTHRP